MHCSAGAINQGYLLPTYVGLDSYLGKLTLSRLSATVKAPGMLGNTPNSLHREIGVAAILGT